MWSLIFSAIIISVPLITPIGAYFGIDPLHLAIIFIANLELGFLKHKKVLEFLNKSEIAVVPSRWEEPFGRTSLEASASGCAVIITNKGGLPETVTNAKILTKLTVTNLSKKIEELINNKNLRKNLQHLSIKNFYLTHSFVTNQIDKYRKEKLFLYKFNTKKLKENLKSRTRRRINAKRKET
mgnify:CR=1 FL=1